MALTKSRTSLYSAQTLTAGAGDTTSSAVDVSGSYSTVINITLTNGGTGPTVAAQSKIQVANDTGGTLWVDYTTCVGSLTASAVTPFTVELPAAVQAFRLVSGSNTGQNVTLNADYSRVTAV